MHAQSSIITLMTDFGLDDFFVGAMKGVILTINPTVTIVDVIHTMLDESLPLTVGEFEEWGNPKDRTFYEYMKSYCPYTSLGPRAYPVMLVRTSLYDSQVMYWEPAKWVAKLRAVKAGDSLLLFKINMDAGHGGASGRYDALRELAFDYAFVLGELGRSD